MYYSRLGVSKNADAEELKKAFRNLAMRYHPDKNPEGKARVEAEVQFKLVNEAFSVLTDPRKKLIYDQLGDDEYKRLEQQAKHERAEARRKQAVTSPSPSPSPSPKLQTTSPTAAAPPLSLSSPSSAHPTAISLSKATSATTTAFTQQGFIMRPSAPPQPSPQPSPKAPAASPRLNQSPKAASTASPLQPNGGKGGSGGGFFSSLFSSSRPSSAAVAATSSSPRPPPPLGDPNATVKVITIPLQMKAYVYSSTTPFGMEFKSVPTPTLPPSSNNVLVKVMAASINPIDYKKDKIPIMNWGLDGKPVAQDFSGIILIANKGSGFNPGDQVYGMTSGSIAEYLVADSGSISLKPKSLTFEESAALPTIALTGYQALKEVGGLSKGMSCMVVGATGGCGSFGLALARHLVGKEGKVAAVCSSRGEMRVRASDLATPSLILDYTRPFETLLGPQSPLNDPSDLSRPFDCIYDTVTSPENADGLEGKPYDEVLMPRHLSKKGRYVAINGSEKRWAAAITGLQALPGSQYRLILAKKSSSDLREIARLFDEGHLPKPWIDNVFLFDALGCESAYMRLKSRRAQGKIVVKIDG